MNENFYRKLYLAGPWLAGYIVLGRHFNEHVCKSTTDTIYVELCVTYRMSY